MMLAAKIAGIVLWISGALVFITDYLKVRRCTCEASAVILDVIEEVHYRRNGRGSRRQSYYFPVIEFTTPDKTIRAKTRIKAYHPDTFVKGNRLDILYNPQNPYDLKLRGNSLWESVIGMGFLFILGAVFFYIGMRTP